MGSVNSVGQRLERQGLCPHCHGATDITITQSCQPYFPPSQALQWSTTETCRCCDYAVEGDGISSVEEARQALLATGVYTVRAPELTRAKLASCLIRSLRLDAQAALASADQILAGDWRGTLAEAAQLVRALGSGEVVQA